MKFVELSSSEFEKASNNFPGSSFYQSYAWAQKLNLIKILK